jgi:hypothetical protein
VFTARYALSPYIKQIRFVFKGLILDHSTSWRINTKKATSMKLGETEKTGNSVAALSVLI